MCLSLFIETNVWLHNKAVSDMSSNVNVNLILIAFLKIYLQLNLVISKLTSPLQNFELYEIRLEGCKGLSKISFCVI